MSSFTWIDHSEKQRRQILDVMDLFRDKDTRDELGVAGIRDAFSDVLFPATGALQTRARYFLFIPWMYRDFAERRLSSADVARRARKFELQLIDTLASSADPLGTIGRFARASLQRFPSSIYWFGLGQLRIRNVEATQAEYQRSFDRRLAVPAATRANDDGEVLQRDHNAWHAGLPDPPDDFPASAAFAMTRSEAEYLKVRVIETHPSSLFAYFLSNGYSDVEVGSCWEHPATHSIEGELARSIIHARNFSDLMHGATILYNLYLAELEPRRDAVINECEGLFASWASRLNSRRESIAAWRRDDFWTFLAKRGYAPTALTRAFVDEWFRKVLNETTEKLRSDPSTRELISRRESQIKGALARFGNRAARERWSGEAGLGQLNFRWGNAKTILRDIASGLGAKDA